MSGLWGIKMRWCGAGRRNTPLYTGQRPERTLKREDFPHPLGPEINTCWPGTAVNERLGTTRSQFGVTIGTASSTSSPPTEFSTLPSMTGTPSRSLIPETSETAARLNLLLEQSWNTSIMLET